MLSQVSTIPRFHAMRRTGEVLRKLERPPRAAPGKNSAPPGSFRLDLVGGFKMFQHVSTDGMKR